MSGKYNFSYSTLADVYAVAEDNETDADKLSAFALELERMGMASLDGVSYILRDTVYGQEIVSEDDLELEKEGM